MERGFGAKIVSGPLLLCMWTLHTNNNIMEEKERMYDWDGPASIAQMYMQEKEDCDRRYNQNS